MGGFFNNSVTLLVVIGCACALCLFLMLCVCLFCIRKKNAKTSKGKSDKDQKETVEMDSLLFVYDTNVERQQSPTRYPASCPVSPSESELGIKKSSSHLDLTQPIYSQDGGAYRRNSMDPSDLDLKLYQDEEEVSSPYIGLGKLSLSLSYNKTNEKLSVYVGKGLNIQAKHTNSSPSPYLKVCLLPDKKRRMHSKTRKGEHPVFNEEFIFSVPQAELAKRILRIAICDFDRFSRQTVLGYVVIGLQDEMETLLQGNDAGEVWKDLSDNDALPGLCKGELLFSLSYLPTAGRITIAVVKAKDLNIHRDSGVAVKVNLVLNGKVAKSKKTSVHKLDIAAPTFNESFVYEISGDLLDRASFILIVYAYNSNGKRVIGKANTGPYMYSTGTGLTHWNDMLLQPRRTTSHWHTLM